MFYNNYLYNYYQILTGKKTPLDKRILSKGATGFGGDEGDRRLLRSTRILTLRLPPAAGPTQHSSLKTCI
jgi:hypothetical protein